MRLLFILFSLLLFSTNADTKKLLEAACKRYKLPSLAVVVTHKGKVVESEIVGVRKAGSNVLATLNDKYHIGSCTKSMTATLAGVLVDEGKINWTTTLEESFPELNAKMHKYYKKVTLAQLLSHTAGVPDIHKTEKKLSNKLYDERLRAKPQNLRSYMIEEVLTKRPAYKVGSRFLYSNCSVSIAGVMLEKAAGKSWEELIQEKIAKPLNITSLGFGDAAVTSAIDQPYNHVIKGGKAVPLSSLRRFDNSPAIAPAATVHLSVLDFAKYTNLYAHSGKGLLKLKTFEEIVKVRKDNYALGWYNVYRKWGGNVLNHNGSNTMNFATMWISPNKTFSIVLVTNCYGSQVPKAIDEICWSIIQKHL